MTQLPITPMNRTQQLVVQWANDRNLIKGSTPAKQLVKLYEEFGELCSGVAKNNVDVIKDSIGDFLVVAAIMCEQQDCELEFERINTARNEMLFTDAYSFTMKDKSVEELVAALGMLTGSFADDILFGSSPFHDETTATDICTGLSALTFIADAYGLKIEECFEYAYDQIKDRKGRMVDGIFVKEADL